MRRVALPLLALGMLSLSCDPDDVPRFSADGKRVALLLDSAGNDAKGEEPAAVGVVSVEGGRLTTHRPPKGWTADGLTWVGERLLVNASRPLTEAERKGDAAGRTREPAYWLLDPASGKWERAPVEPHITLTPFVGRHKGQPCIYAPQMPPEGAGLHASGTTVVLAMDGTTRLATLPYEVEGAGDGWMIRVVEEEMDRPLVKGKGPGADWIRESLPEDKRTRKSVELAYVDVLDPDGKQVVRIGRDEIGRACYRDVGNPVCARISSDHGRLLLGFDTETLYRPHTHEHTFGVYGLATGKLLWSSASNGLRGLPAFVGDKLYVLEAKTRRREAGEPVGEAVLAQHTPAGRKVILELPLRGADKVARYSHSADRAKFVVLVEGPAPRLLLVPIRERVAPEEITEILLKGQ